MYIMPAEHIGEANSPGRILDIGGVKIDVWGESVSVYVRRDSDDLRVIEIHIVRHDGLAQEELDQQNAEAERYPLGPKEYWRSEMVGKYTYGSDGHTMTDEEFEADWVEHDE